MKGRRSGKGSKMTVQAQSTQLAVARFLLVLNIAFALSPLTSFTEEFHIEVGMNCD